MKNIDPIVIELGFFIFIFSLSLALQFHILENRLFYGKTSAKKHTAAKVPRRLKAPLAGKCFCR